MTMAMTMPEIGIHQDDDGFRDFEGLPTSHEGEIDSDDVGRSVEPQAEEDVRNSGGLSNRKMKSSRPEEDVRCLSEIGNGKEESSRSGRELDGGVTPDLPPINFSKVFGYGFVEMLATVSLCSFIHGVLVLLLVLCSRSFSGELHVNQHEDSKDLHHKISEMRIVETPVHLLALACFNLLDHKPDDSLWEESDWKYAHSRAKAILNCIEIASEDNELKMELENLKDARRRMPSEVMDIVQPWNILWGVLSCFIAVSGRFWFDFGMDLDRRTSLLNEKVTTYSLLIVLLSNLRPNPILWTYNLEWLGTTYYWLFHFLSGFGYYVGWTVFLRGVESWILELEKHSNDPCLRTVVSGREDLDSTLLKANYHQDDSTEDQRKKRPSRTVVFGLVTLVFVTTFEQALGYSIVNVFFRCCFFWCVLLARKSWL